MTNKTTKKDLFTLAIEVMNKPELIESNSETLINFFNRELELLNKKKNSSKSVEKSQTNEKLKSTLLRALSAEVDPVTVSELINHNPNILFDGQRISNQKASFLLNQLVKEGKVEKGKRKSLSIFMIPLTEEEEDMEGVNEEATNE